jgi:lipoprotein-anchoring transpeptidase ErfK/SrfK
MYRYTRVSLYSEVEVDGYIWYQIGENQWVHQFNVAKILSVPRPEEITTTKWVSVDLYEQVLIAYEGSTPVFSTLISSGLADWPTNEGVFNVYMRRERTVMSGGYGAEDFYFLEEVPWTMFFDHDIALHGTFWHDGFGYRQSHGCVNMSIIDAHWLFNWSSDVKDWTVEDSPDLSVYVYSSGEYS